MAGRRFFVDSIRAGQAEPRGDEARHVTRVLRGESGQHFEILDNGAVCGGEVVEARGERVEFAKVILPQEKELLEQVLESSLGVSRKKPATKRAPAKKKAAKK